MTGSAALPAGFTRRHSATLKVYPNKPSCPISPPKYTYTVSGKNSVSKYALMMFSASLESQVAPRERPLSVLIVAPCKKLQKQSRYWVITIFILNSPFSGLVTGRLSPGALPTGKARRHSAISQWLLKLRRWFHRSLDYSNYRSMLRCRPSFRIVLLHR